MPELPEVEHVVRALRRVVIGRRIVAAEVTLPKLIAPTTPSAFKRKLEGSTITGKFLYLSADDALPKHARAVFYLDNDRRLVFSDQRKFGVMRLVAKARLSKTKGIGELAPEPFSDDFNVSYLKDTLARS